MKFVIQRAIRGSVKVENNIVGEIEKGLVVLIGFTSTDKKEDLKFAANKLLNLRLWDSDTGVRWKESVKDKNFSLLIVSQFTLYSILKGNKPDFHYALDPIKATELYDEFLQLLKGMYKPEKIQCGIFGAYMHVDLVNDGPVTINWEYPEVNSSDNNSSIENKAKENNNNNKKVQNNSEKNKSKNKSGKNNKNLALDDKSEKEIKNETESKANKESNLPLSIENENKKVEEDKDLIKLPEELDKKIDI